jgi:hypothetical protein
VLARVIRAYELTGAKTNKKELVATLMVKKTQYISEEK